MTLANWRDLSIILLVIEAFFLSLVPAAVLYLCVRGISLIIKQVRMVAPPVQRYFSKAAEVSEQASRKITAPVIGASASAAQVRHWRTAMAPSNLIKKEV